MPNTTKNFIFGAVISLKTNRSFKIVRRIFILGLIYLIFLSLTTWSIQIEDLMNGFKGHLDKAFNLLKQLFFGALGVAISIAALAAGATVYIYIKSKIHGDESHLQESSKSGLSVIAIIFGFAAGLLTFSILQKGTSATFGVNMEETDNSSFEIKEKKSPAIAPNENKIDSKSIFYDSFKIYKDSGMSGLISLSRDCYRTLDQSVTYNNFKKCVLIDMFSHEIDMGLVRTSKLPLQDYFSTNSFQKRAALYIKGLGFTMTQTNIYLSECESEVRNQFATIINN